MTELPKKSESVRVVIRCRPFSSQEEADGRRVCVSMDTPRASVTIQKPGMNSEAAKDFTFDATFGMDSTQENIYDVGYTIVDSVLEGYNGTIFAYGQTGTGKTHTMVGVAEDPHLQGIIPRAFKQVFNMIQSDLQRQFLVRVSFLEIYNEEIRDLLSKNPKDRLELKDSPDSGVYVKDLSAFVVKGVDEMHQVMAAGQRNRSTGSTLMNAESSRSHSIFTITIEMAEGEHIRVGKLNMVDLAGSERQSKTGATNETLKEATKINLSLSALGNVISALVDQRTSFVPYRDSKLTRLLQDSLGGNTKTVMVANVGPADYNYDESLSTLRYAHRAKSIKNKPKINEDPKDAMMREFQDEIMRLKSELAARGGGGGTITAGPGGALTRKQVVEKIVEKDVVVEKLVERVVDTGVTDDDIANMKTRLESEKQKIEKEQENEKIKIMTAVNMSESERQKLMRDLETRHEKLEAERNNQLDLIGKLKTMEDKMLKGNEVMAKALEQETHLHKARRELEQREKAQNQYNKMIQEQEDEQLGLQDRYQSQEDQAQKLTAKLEKLWNKFKRAKQELTDVQMEFQTEKEDILEAIRDLTRDIRLKSLIMESFVPPEEVKMLEEGAVWSEDDGVWKFEVKFTPAERPRRPGSAVGCPRPTTDFARVHRAMGDTNPRFRYDQILQTDLDLMDRLTEDYTSVTDLPANVRASIEVAVAAADGGGERGGGKHARPASAAMRETNPGAFPVARGLVGR